MSLLEAPAAEVTAPGRWGGWPGSSRRSRAAGLSGGPWILYAGAGGGGPMTNKSAWAVTIRSGHSLCPPSAATARPVDSGGPVVEAGDWTFAAAALAGGPDPGRRRQ